MIKLYLAFIFLFGVFFFGITAFRKLSGKEQLALTKLIAYSIICSVLAIAGMMTIVILF
jgi:hypothetical protein